MNPRKKNSMRHLSILFLIILVYLFQTIAYSIISQELLLSGDAYARAISDIRISNIEIKEISNANILYSNEFNIDTFSSGLELYNESSYILYQISIENKTEIPYAINSIEELNDSNQTINYEIIDYDLTTPIPTGITKIQLKLQYTDYENRSSTIDETSIKFNFQTPAPFKVTSSNKATIGYTGENDENLVIPAYFSDETGTLYRVTEIDSNTFSGATNLKTISIPNTVQNIGEGAFANCNSLESININDNPNFILDNGILYNKDQTLLIHYPVGQNSNTHIEIAETVTKIGNYSMANHPEILTTNLNKLENLLSIGNYAFYNNTNQTSQTGDLVIPNKVETIGTSAFENCKGYTGTLDLNQVKTISGNAFKNCTNLSDLKLSLNMTSIPWASFIYCNGMIGEELRIHEGIKSIGGQSLNGLKYDKLYLPSTLTSINNDAIRGFSLKQILINIDSYDKLPSKTNAPWNWDGNIPIIMTGSIRNVEWTTSGDYTTGHTFVFNPIEGYKFPDTLKVIFANEIEYTIPLTGSTTEGITYNDNTLYISPDIIPTITGYKSYQLIQIIFEGVEE